MSLEPPLPPRSSRGRTKLTFRGLVALLVAVTVVVAGIALLVNRGNDPETKPIAFPGASPVPDEGDDVPSETPSPEPLFTGTGPINPDYPGLTTLRGNWTRSFFGIGPVPLKPKVKWREGPWCGVATDLGETSTWCGTGWNGQPNVIPMPNGGVEVRIGGYDYDYHFLDGETGEDTHPPFKTGDTAKGSATSDPDGCDLYYAGSRDNNFRIIGLDKKKPRELWSMNADSSVSNPEWNDDWDGSAQIVGDYMLVGGENSWFYVIKLNKQCNANSVKVSPKIVFSTPGWDSQLVSDLNGVQNPSDISIENSVAYDDERKVAYFGNGGGLVQGYDISNILNGGGSAKRVFRYWMGGENDASIVIAADGDLIASSHLGDEGYSYSQSRKSGTLTRLDPTKDGNPVIWKIKEIDGTEAGFFSTPALVGDILYASANQGDLMAIDAETGKKLWTEQLTPPLWSGPAVVDDVLVIGDCSGTLYAFDVSDPRKNPKQLWDLKLGGCIESTPAIWDGWIYIGTRAGYFYGIADKNPANLERDAAPGVSPSPAPSP